VQKTGNGMAKLTFDNEKRINQDLDYIKFNAKVYAKGTKRAVKEYVRTIANLGNTKEVEDRLWVERMAQK